MPEMSDVEIERLKAKRFSERVQRVLVVMQREGVDWRAVPFVTPDGRIGTRVMPVDLPARQTDGGQAGMGTRLTEEAPAPRDSEACPEQRRGGPPRGPERAGHTGRET